MRQPVGPEYEDHDGGARSEEHTSELQSQSNLVCRLLVEKKTWPCPLGPTGTASDAVQPRHSRTASCGLTALDLPTRLARVHGVRRSSRSPQTHSSATVV